MATTFSQGLRALRAPTLRLCGLRVAVTCHPRWLSTSLPRFNGAEALRKLDTDFSGDGMLGLDEPDAKTTDPPATKGLPFSSLHGKLTTATLAAITTRPMKLTNMTPVQERVLEMLPGIAQPYTSDKASGPPRDLMVRAKTGTGKTLAFLVPAIESRINAIEAAGKQALREAGISANRELEERARRIYAKHNVGTLILSPTRELAQQISNEAQKLSSQHSNFNVLLLFGGASKRKQIKEWLSGRPDIVVSTTGRLRDLINSVPEIVNGLKGTKILILDEADTMLDMGFREDINAIIKVLPKAPERQTFVFSATINKTIQEVVQNTLSSNNTFINTVGEDTSPVHAHVAQHKTVLSSAADQLPHTLRLIAHDQLTNPTKSKVIVFLPTTKMTILYATLLRGLVQAVLPAGRSTRVYELHSRRSMDQRVRTSDMFRKDSSGSSILVTSDVSARGVDYPNVSRVIQIGVPQSGEQYIHRVGRTGRMGGMVGRGDIVLLPWEAGFAQYELADVPIKHISPETIEKELSELASKYDENPSAFFPAGRHTVDRSGRQIRAAEYKSPVASRLEAVQDEVERALSSTDDEIKSETFSALLGYYVGRGTALRISKDEILQKCREWVVQACGLPEAPYVSASFLAKVGIPRPKSFGDRIPRSGGSSWSGGDRNPRRSDYNSERRSGYSSEGRLSNSWNGGERSQRSWTADERPKRDGERPQRSWSGGERTQKSWGSDERPKRSWDAGDRPRRSFDRSFDRE